MSLDIFFLENIRNAILAADEATNYMKTQVPEGQIYRAGYQAALVTIALAFGLPPTLINCSPPATVDSVLVIPKLDKSWTM